MIQFCGYNFFQDGNALDPFPTSVNDITTTELSNAIFDDFYVTKDTSSAYSTTVPTEWDFYTIMLANFNGNLNAGNIDALLSQLTSIRIKRRPVGSFDWITIREIPVETLEDISFIFDDNFGANLTEYEYAWVPVLNEVEGNYIIKSILSQFNGVFICDLETVYKFVGDVAYGTSEQVQKIGTFEPFGRQYPVYVSNAMTNYQKGSLSAKIMGRYETTGVFNRQEMVSEKNALLSWLTNKQAKIIKDYNGNIWLVVIIGNPSVIYNGKWGNGIMDVSLNYSETGSVDSASDLRSAGLAPNV